VSAFAKFYFRPSKGERIHTVVIPKEDDSCGICGKVTDGERAIKGALVLLFAAEGQETGKLLSSVATDEDGEFAFGPLYDGELYLIKVYKDSLKLRELEIVV
jgi:hypothetical protein